MRSATRLTSIAFFALFSAVAGAVDVPQDSLGAEKFDAMKCIEQNTQTCINSICLNSEQRDCQDNCAKTAKEKCRAQSNE